MRRHPIVRHGPPRMVLWRRLRIPNVACISGEVAGLKRANDSVALNQLAAGRINEIAAALHMRKHLVVEEVLGRRIKRHLEIDDVNGLHQRLSIRMVGETKLLFDTGAQSMRVGVMQMQPERLEPMQHYEYDTSRSTRP